MSMTLNCYSRKFLSGRKYAYCILIVAVSLISCRPSDKWTNHPNSEDTKIAWKLFELFNSHDWKTMSELYIDSALFLDPSFGKKEIIKTQIQTASKYAAMQKIFPNIKDEVQHMYSFENNVIVEFISSGADSNGHGFSLPIVTIFTIKDGKITRDATYYDQ